MKPSRLQLLILAGLATTPACHRYKIHPIAPVTKGATGAVALPSEPRLVILSPVSLAQVSSELTLETEVRPSTGGATARGVLQTFDYNEAQTYFEAAFIAYGWRPVNSGLLVRAAAEPEVRRALKSAGNLTLSEAAMLMAPYVDADAIFVLRAVTVQQSAPSFVCEDKDYGIFAYEVMVDGVVVAVQTGEVVWSGNTVVRSESMLTKTLEGSYGDCQALSDFKPAPIEHFCVGHKNYCGDKDHGPIDLSALVEKASTSMVYDVLSKARF